MIEGEIVPSKKKTVSEIQAILAESKFVFHPTGSRYIGYARSDSDWDYIAANTPPCRAFLEGLGFKMMGDEKYALLESDHIGADVLEYVADDGKIQIQMSNYPSSRLFARDVIKEHFAVDHLHMNREKRQEFWTMLQEAYMYAKEDRADLPF